MSKKTLPNLDPTQVNLVEEDLFLVRKSGSPDDNSIKFQNLCKSVGNSSIIGYKATVNSQANGTITLQLTPVNNIPIPYTLTNSLKIPDFNDGSLIFFTFPVDFKGIISLKILDKTYTLIVSSDSSTYFSCKEGDYFVIKYAPIQGVDNRFLRINDFDHVVFTNIYDVGNITNNPSDITISLISTYGVQKQKYRKGMEIFFVPTETIISNNILISIDELGFTRQALRFADSTLQTTLVKNQEVRAVHNGIKFVISPQDYPQLLPAFSYKINIDDYNYFNLKNRFYTNLANYNLSFSIGEAGDYKTLEEAIIDIEQRFSHNKENIKVRFVIDSIDLTKTIVIDRDLSYIELYPQSNNIMTFNSSLCVDMFHIINNGKFFSIFYNSLIQLRSTANLTQPGTFNFIRIQNNVFNIFEKFVIRIKDLAVNVKISRIFFIYIASGGIAIKDVVMDSDLNNGYTNAINFGLYSLNAFLYNVKVKKWNSVGLEIGYSISVGNESRPHNHKIFIVNCDFSKTDTISNNDIYFRLQNGYGYTILNQTASKAGCNVTANTSSPDWGWYSRNGDGTTQGNF